MKKCITQFIPSFKFFALLLCLITLNACAPKTPSPTAVAPQLSIGLAPITQPLETTELMAGYFPEERILATEAELNTLNSLIQREILKNPRAIKTLEAVNYDDLLEAIEENSTKGILAYWIEYGKHEGVDLLLVPQVLYYKDKGTHGENALMLDFFLIDTREAGLLLKRSHFAQEAQATDGNLLGMLAFSKRVGDSSIEAMTIDAVDTMLEEFEF